MAPLVTVVVLELTGSDLDGALIDKGAGNVVARHGCDGDALGVEIDLCFLCRCTVDGRQHPAGGNCLADDVAAGCFGKAATGKDSVAILRGNIIEAEHPQGAAKAEVLDAVRLGVFQDGDGGLGRDRANLNSGDIMVIFVATAVIKLVIDDYVVGAVGVGRRVGIIDATVERILGAQDFGVIRIVTQRNRRIGAQDNRRIGCGARCNRAGNDAKGLARGRHRKVDGLQIAIIGERTRGYLHPVATVAADIETVIPNPAIGAILSWQVGEARERVARTQVDLNFMGMGRTG